MPYRPDMLSRAREINHLDACEPLAIDFKVVVTVKSSGDLHYGQLKILRRADRKILFPFDGAPTIGPYPTWRAAHDAAMIVARKAIAADLANPEI